ncbi:MAG: PBP1A family penicillin-binding protein [Rhodobacter sp.]|nr:PBP1A family penicillin-binding protein [Rhodobacter sp.]MCY4167151.1 PBP1A family penicillin-binding protein [Rhodobacter sp.]MCY4241286.1 PBP1A family penicillin-binding protein [Rhodobacter sp.]
MLRFILSFLGAVFAVITNGAILIGFLFGAVLWTYGQDLPSTAQLERYTPPTISRIYSGEGRLVDEFARERRLFTPPDEIPDLVKHAFISAEDRNFYSHKGYDLRGMAAAGIEAIRGGRLRGASTITQQVMKIFLLSSDRTIERKIKEIILATRVERALSKDEILALYLNQIDLGARSFGATAAAQTYFNKTLAELNVQEAAFLAIHPKAPYSYHPVNDRDAAIERRNFVLKEMRENGYLTPAAEREASAAPLLTVQSGDYESYRASLPPRGYFTDEIRRQLSRHFGEEEFYNGGLSIRATMDPDLQNEASKALRLALEGYDRDAGVWRGTGLRLEAEALVEEAEWREALHRMDLPRDIDGWYPAVVLDVEDTAARIGIEGVADDGNGHWILAEDVTWARKRLANGALTPKARVAGDLLEEGDVIHVRPLTDSGGSSVSWSLRQVPEIQGAFMAMDVNTGRVLAMQGGFSYQVSAFNRATQATRQPGSSFKPFVYAAALDSGFSPATIVIDAPISIDTGTEIWRPANATDRFYGPTPLRTGIERSRNLMTVRLAREVGMQTVASYAERFGVYDRLQPYLANALGSQESTLFRIVAAYAMFANGGERLEPTLVDRVQNRWGETVYRHDRRVCEGCQRAVLDPGTGPRIKSNRERVMDAITAYQLTSMMQGVVERGTASGRIDLDVPAAGKTGTTNDARDVWFVGFTSNIVAGCYIGYDRPRSMGRSASGGRLCAPVFNQFMHRATERYGGGPFEVPSGGTFIKIDRYSGARLSGNEEGPHVVAEYFREGGETLFGVTFDGGFAMGSDLPIIVPSDAGGGQASEAGNDDGNADFGTLSSGGLY